MEDGSIGNRRHSKFCCALCKNHNTGQQTFRGGAICTRSNGDKAQVSIWIYVRKRPAFRPHLTGSNNAERERLRLSSNFERAI